MSVTALTRLPGGVLQLLLAHGSCVGVGQGQARCYPRPVRLCTCPLWRKLGTIIGICWLLSCIVREYAQHRRGNTVYCIVLFAPCFGSDDLSYV